jgi:hypothetical protein
MRTRSDHRPCRAPAVAREAVSTPRVTLFPGCGDANCTEVVMRACGFTPEQLAELVRDGFVTKTQGTRGWHNRSNHQQPQHVIRYPGREASPRTRQDAAGAFVTLLASR